MNHDKYLVDLGNKIKRLRNDLGYSQDELAELIHSNRLAIFRIETGKVNSSIGRLRELAEVLKVELGDLVTL